MSSSPKTATEFLVTFTRLKRQEKVAQIDYNTTLQHAKNSDDVTHYLQQTQRLSDKQRLEENKRVIAHLCLLYNQIQQVKIQIQQKQPNLKSLLLTLDGNLQAARQTWQISKDQLDQRSEALASEIKQAFSRYNSVERDYEVLEQNKRVEQEQYVSQNIVNRSSVQSIIQQLDEKLDRLKYPNGGWPSEQHNKFYGYWLQNKDINRQQFIEMIQNKFPEYTVPALLRHDEFCFACDDLVQQKKNEIAKWRHAQSQNVQANSKIVSQETENQINQRKLQIDQQKKEKVRAYQEWKLMNAEDQFSYDLLQNQKFAAQAKEARIKAGKAARNRMQQELQRKKIIEDQMAENQRIINLENARRKAGTDLQYLQRQKNQQQLLERQQQYLIDQKAKQKEKLEEVEKQKQREERIIQKLQLQIIGDNIPTNYLQETEAQKQRVEQVRAYRQSGKKFGQVNVGFDPFALNPIGGGRAAAKW